MFRGKVHIRNGNSCDGSCLFLLKPQNVINICTSKRNNLFLQFFSLLVIIFSLLNVYFAGMDYLVHRYLLDEMTH